MQGSLLYGYNQVNETLQDRESQLMNNERASFQVSVSYSLLSMLSRLKLMMSAHSGDVLFRAARIVPRTSLIASGLIRFV